MDPTPSHHRLKIVVHIDPNMERACIEVRGTLTPANIRALYVIARRARTLLPGKEIVLDLTMARAAMETIEALHSPVHITQLSGEGTSDKPCRLSILDPRPGARGLDHKHPDHKHGDHAHADHKHADTEADVKHADRTSRKARDKEPA